MLLLFFFFNNYVFTQTNSFLFSDLELQRHTSKPWSPIGQFDSVNHLQIPTVYTMPAFN